jgi:carotenoid cleavage dioxygenase-like enzyme
VVHSGLAMTTHYQCGDGYRMDPRTLEQQGPETWVGGLPADWGISAHTKVDEATGELMYFSYSKEPPYLRYGLVSADNRMVHGIPVELPGPRLPHDMAFTTNYAILNDCPMFWDPDLLRRNIHAVRFFPDMPTRFAVVPRQGSSDQIRWFEASPTYVLHWINAYENGDEIVLDGFHQAHPIPDSRSADDRWQQQFRFLDAARLETRAHRWRLNLRTGHVKEEFLHDEVFEFGKINGRHGGQDYRYTYGMTNEPGWFLFNGLVRLDVKTGELQRYTCREGTFLSESPMAPRPGTSDDNAEDNGYVLTLTTDLLNNCSECLVFDAHDIGEGPVARVRLPERISSGTHACWATATTDRVVSGW